MHSCWRLRVIGGSITFSAFVTGGRITCSSCRLIIVMIIHASRNAVTTVGPRASGDLRRLDKLSGHPTASSVPKWLTFCLQWFLFQ
jgi:hypothetical protein